MPLIMNIARSTLRTVKGAVRPEVNGPRPGSIALSLRSSFVNDINIELNLCAYLECQMQGET